MNSGTSHASAVNVDSSDEDTTPAPPPPKPACMPRLLKVAQTIAKKAQTTRKYKIKKKEKPPPPYFFNEADLITSDPGNYHATSNHCRIVRSYPLDGFGPSGMPSLA